MDFEAGPEEYLPEVPDTQTETAETLRARYGVWGNHPRFPREDWVYEVRNEDTVLGYWDWVADQLAFADLE